MSKQTAWLELFTGVVIDDPDTQERQTKLKASVDASVNAQAVYERKKQAQAEALAVVRAKFEKIKSNTQQVLSAKIESGPFKGKSFLDIKGGQIKEIDVEDVSAESTRSGVPPIPDEITQKLLSAGYAIGDLGRELREKRFQPDLSQSDDEDLFSNEELQSEFWTPVMRERIFPEGFIAGPWSATQRMLDETNALYQEMVEKKKLAGELTPERDFLKDSLETGGKLLSVAASALSGFEGKDLELAKEILDTSSEVLGSLAEVRDKLKNNEFADASSVVFDIAASLTSSVLKGAGVDESTVKAASGALNAGGSAVLLGKTLNQVRTGEANLSQALLQMGDVLGQALATASQGTDNEAAKSGLEIAAKAAPTLFKALGLGSDLPDLVRDGDYQGVINRFAELTKDVLQQLPGLDNLGIDLGTVIDLGASTLTISIKTAFAAKKGEYLRALNGVIGDVGGILGKVLDTAGVDSALSEQIVKLYQGSASAPKALELMRQDPPKVSEAIETLVGGIESALGGTGDDTLKAVGENLALGVKTLITAEQIAKLYKAEKFDEAVDLFSTNLTEGFKKLSGSLGITADEDDREDEGGTGGEGEVAKSGSKTRAQGDEPAVDDKAAAKLKNLLADLKKAKVDPEKVKEATELLQKKKDEEQAAADLAEAEELLAEAKLDLKALTDAERTGSEASNIEQMIADLLRDRMILKLATQIAQGGAAFLAQFLPGLGAAAAGIKLAASLMAAGQRTQQLDQWLKTKTDLKNAQSELSSSAANFVKNQGQQLAHYSAQAFFAAAQLAGEIAKLSGPGAGVGAIISASAMAGAKAEELMMDLKNKYDVEAGWKATQKALRNPGNRRLGLEARKLNPTLAKYSIAWGAVVLKDPLARGAMKACGLTEASLKDENADTHKVVKYLETFYEDDVSIYRDATVDAPDWVPAEIEISLSCWAAFRRGAQNAWKTDKDALTIENAALVEGLFGEFEGVQEAADKTAEVLDAAQAEFSFAGKVLRAATEGGTAKKGSDAALPDTTALRKAITDHAVTLRVRSETAQRLYFALLGAAPKANDQEKAKKVLDAATAALQVFRAKADRVFKAAKLDAEGLDEANAELERTMTTLQQKVDEAKAKQERLEDGRPRSGGSTTSSQKPSKTKSKETDTADN